MALATQEARRRSVLATARALEAIAATHKQNAIDLAATRVGSSEDGVRHYIKTMDLPTHQAQMVYQQALAAMAEQELADAPEPAVATVPAAASGRRRGFPSSRCGRGRASARGGAGGQRGAVSFAPP